MSIRWKRNILSGVYTSGEKKIVPEPHGSEGLLHYYLGHRRFEIEYFNGVERGIWWGIDGDHIYEVHEDGSRILVGESEKYEILEDLTRATNAVWRKRTVNMRDAEVKTENGEIPPRNSIDR